MMKDAVLLHRKQEVTVVGNDDRNRCTSNVNNHITTIIPTTIRVWNETFVAALEARADIAQTKYQQAQSQSQPIKSQSTKRSSSNNNNNNKNTSVSYFRQQMYTWRTGAKAIRSIRPDIYVETMTSSTLLSPSYNDHDDNNNNNKGNHNRISNNNSTSSNSHSSSNTSTTRVVIHHLSSKLVSKPVYELCYEIVTGIQPIYPSGYIPFDPMNVQHKEHYYNNHHQSKDSIESMNPYLDDPYLNRIKKRGGSYAILMSLMINQIMDGSRSSLSKEQLCQMGQNHCDEKMEANYHAGRIHGAWESINTLQKHGLVTVENILQQHAPTTTDPDSTTTFTNSSTTKPTKAITKQKLKTKNLWTYSLTSDGILFVQAMMEKNQSVRDEIQKWTTSTSTSSSTSTNTTTSRSFTTMTTTSTRPREPPPKVTVQVPNQKCYNDFSFNHEQRKSNNTVVNSTVTGSHPKIRNTAPTISTRDDNKTDPMSRPTLAATNHYNNNNNNSSRVTTTSSFHNPYAKRINPKEVTQQLIKEKENQKLVGNFHQQWYPHDTKRNTVIQQEVDMIGRKNERISSFKKCDWIVLSDSDSDSDESESESVSFISSSQEEEEAEEKNLHDNNDDNNSLDAQIYHDEIQSSLQQLAIRDSTDFSCSSTEDLDYKSTNQLTTPTGLAMVFLDSDSDDDDDDLLHFQPFQKKNITTQVKDTSLSSGIISTGQQQQQQQTSFIISIDDRERDRNCTPRQLRFDLLKFLTTGMFVSYCCQPRNVPHPQVEEQRLKSGDFAYEKIMIIQPNTSNSSTNTNGTSSTMLSNHTNRHETNTPTIRCSLPLLVERKRISDIVQRSRHKAHWNQLHRMRTTVQSIHSRGIHVLLLEGDVTTASWYANNNNDDDDHYHDENSNHTYSPYDHTIYDEQSLYRFIGRIVIRDKSVRFIQTKDELASIRFVSILGFSAILSEIWSSCNDHQVTPVLDWKAEHSYLINRLQKHGLPYEIAERVADEMGSLKVLESIYDSAENDYCRMYLLTPIFKDFYSRLPGSASEWSYKVWQVLQTNHSSFGITGTAISDAHLPYSECTRFVEIHVPAELQFVIPTATNDTTEETFYRILKSNVSDIIPTLLFRSVVDSYCSTSLLVSVVDGADILCYLKTALIAAKRDCFSASETAATKLVGHIRQSKMMFRTTTKNNSVIETATNETMSPCGSSYNANTNRHILIIRGMDMALTKAAKSNGFRPELRLLVDMLQSNLMIQHEIVVLHAQRKENNFEMIIQQLALACYEFQFITKAL